MDSYKVVLRPTTQWTRVLVSHGPDDVLRAILPAAVRMGHPRATATFLEGLALWCDATLPVVLSVDAVEDASYLGLTDSLGLGARSIFYEVDVQEHARRRRRGSRIRGVGDFADLRQLRLIRDE
jgi:hypothetical protein